MSADLSEEQVSEERDPKLNDEEYIIMDDTRNENWRDVPEDGDDKEKIHYLRWEVYFKEKEELIKRYFLVSVTHPKGGNIVWTWVKYHIIKKKGAIRSYWTTWVWL